MAGYDLSDDPNKLKKDASGNAVTGMQSRYNNMAANPQTNTISAPDYTPPTAPTDVVSTSGQQPSYYSQVKRATRYNDHINQAGLRASLDPYGSMGFRPLRSNEKQGLQQQYRNIANMKGLSNRQRQAFLGEARKQMAQHGMKPQFDLESNKGLSARQIAANQLDRTATDINRVDQVWKQGGAADLHNYNLQKYRDDYQDMLWGRYWE